jgi:hypothetical protein
MNTIPAYWPAIILFFCVSCNELPEDHRSRLPKGEISGRYYQEKPIGQWKYYDESKHVIKLVDYFDSTGSNYEARHFNTHGKLVYLERVEKHKFVYQKPRVDETDQGSLLFNEYCQSCHSFYNAGMGPALYSVTQSQPTTSFSRVALSRSHQSIYRSFEVPVTLSEQDVRAIYEYIKQKGVVAN